jgi:murein tripeptide amidase MpaA
LYLIKSGLLKKLSPMSLKILFTLIASTLLIGNAFSQVSNLTPYEQSGCKSTPRYAQTMAYCRQLQAASPCLKMESIGKSPQGRDIQMLIVDRNHNFTPVAVRKSGNIVLLVQACIHAGEPDGKDAGLMLLRDMLINGKNKALLDHVTLLFIPIFNVDGHERFGPFNRINQNGPEEMGWRTSAQNLNLNRDYLKADAPEMQAFLKNVTLWNPDFFIDCHVTDGADYQYKLTYSLELGGNMEAGLTTWTRDYFEKNLLSLLDKDNTPAFPYVEFRNWHDPRSGLFLTPSSPMYSQGYFAQRNRPGLLIETHMLKDYKTRVEATYQTLQHTMELLNRDHTNFLQTLKNADAYTASAAFRAAAFPVKFRTSYKDSIMVDFKGVAYESVKSDVTGGEWFVYHHDQPTIFKIPFFTKAEPDALVKLPEAYIIPVEWIDAIKRIHLHGIKSYAIKKPTTFTVQAYRFKNTRFRNTSFEGRISVSYDLDTLTIRREYLPGSVIVPMNQPLARLAAYLLEPAADGSLASWGFFDAVMEQKEYTESYVMEKTAREMMSKDPNLRKEFEQKKASDAAFAKNPEAIINWFYSKSPWWDSQLNLYPIGRMLTLQD